MGYEEDLNIIETYTKALLDAPKESTEEVFGSAETIESNVKTMKQRKKREKYIRDASKQVKEIKENFTNITGISASELEGL